MTHSPSAASPPELVEVAAKEIHRWLVSPKYRPDEFLETVDGKLVSAWSLHEDMARAFLSVVTPRIAAAARNAALDEAAGIARRYRARGVLGAYAIEAAIRAAKETSP